MLQREKMAVEELRGYDASVEKALDSIGARDRLPQSGLIILKPNLTNADPPPVTTNVRTVEAVLRYCRKCSQADIAIGEGCGSGITADAFAANGYKELAATYGVCLIDFNEEADVKLSREDARTWKELYMPCVALDAFLISVPVLKDHCFTETTIAMKNMFGLVPAPRYRGSWNKSALHQPSSHWSVFDVCLYKKPDMCVVDCSPALTGMHLSGVPKDFGVILAGFDPVAVDAKGSRMLGHDPSSIEYLTMSDGVLGWID